MKKFLFILLLLPVSLVSIVKVNVVEAADWTNIIKNRNYIYACCYTVPR